jgi:hypothetical protein
MWDLYQLYASLRCMTIITNQELIVPQVWPQRIEPYAEGGAGTK